MKSLLGSFFLPLYIRRKKKQKEKAKKDFEKKASREHKRSCVILELAEIPLPSRFFLFFSFSGGVGVKC
jgi:peptidoglycan biosynthesis protein MviN/MurJ (putative lipid II flippase)